MRLRARPGLPLGAPRSRLARVRAGLSVLAALFLPPVGLAQTQERAPSRADYRIEARLEGETKTLDGKLELRWTNRSGESVRDLWFHLYLNAFSNNRSTHLVEADGKLRNVEMKDGWGWSRIVAIRVAGAENGGFEDVLPSLTYQRPDDDNEEDRTVFRVVLPQALGPGETVRVQID